MAGESILIIEDVKRMQKYNCLSDEGMSYTKVSQGVDVMSVLKKTEIDCVLLDLLLPDMNGFELIKMIRRDFPHLPIIILSAKKKIASKVVRLELGADDYITKPFGEEELITCIRTNIHRNKQSIPFEKKNNIFLSYGELKLDLRKCILIKKDEIIKLSLRLFRLLQYLMENPEKVIEKEELYKNVWDDEFDDNTIKVYIRKLRKSLEDDPDNPVYIQTVPDVGYKFAPPSPSETENST